MGAVFAVLLTLARIIESLVKRRNGSGQHAVGRAGLSEHEREMLKVTYNEVQEFGKLLARCVDILDRIERHLDRDHRERVLTPAPIGGV